MLLSFLKCCFDFSHGEMSDEGEAPDSVTVTGTAQPLPRAVTGTAYHDGYRYGTYGTDTSHLKAFNCEPAAHS